MLYKFPIIRHLNDVLPFVEAGKFYHVQKEGYSVINYAYSSPEVFPPITEETYLENTIKREFRGIKFNDAGDIICRPYHKFFNFNERPDVSADVIQTISEHIPHFMLEKLDGSMIAPFYVNGAIIWGTKMGKTDVSEQVDRFVNDGEINNVVSVFMKKWNLELFVIKCLQGHFFSSKITPIFEWCSDKNRIVLNNEKDRLVLTAMRNMVSGEYFDHTSMLNLAADNDISDAVKFKADGFSNDKVEAIRQEEEKEGYVVRFSNGHMFKIKCDWYCRLHKVKSDVSVEKNVVGLICDRKIDDLYPLMGEVDRKIIQDYQWKFEQDVGTTAGNLTNKIKAMQNENVTKKQFALEISKDYPKWQHGIIFSFLENKSFNSMDMFKTLVVFISKNCGSNIRFDEIRETSLFLNVPKWNINASPDDE